MEITKLPQTDPRLPLPLYESIKIAEAENAGELFDIVLGLTKELVQKLKERAVDDSDEELKATSDRKRFGEGSYEEWYKKERVPFALVHQKTGALAALAWFGPKPLGRKSARRLSPKERLENEQALNAENWHTISYRSYPPFRGKGLMKKFAGFTLEYYAERFPNVRFWAGTDSKNPASMKLAEALGFKIDENASDPEEHWTVMVKE